MSYSYENEIENEFHKSKELHHDGDNDDFEDDSDDDFSDDSDDDYSRDFSNHSRREHETASREKYAFSIEKGVITGVAEVENGVMQPESIKSNEHYSLNGTDILKTEYERSGQKITRYADIDGDGLYIKTSEQWTAGNGTVNAPMPAIHDSLDYFGTSGDDSIGLISDDDSTGGTGADKFVFRQLGHMRIADFSHKDNDKIVFDTGLGLQSLEHLASFVTAINYDGHDTEIEFGEKVSLTLVGCNPADFSGLEFVVLS